MIRHLSLAAVFVFAGCNTTANQSPAASSASATDVTKAMVGQWGVDGEASLIITLDAERVVFAAPPNDTWRMDIRDAKIVGETVHFVQENYLHDGTEHPFNGVACNSIVKLVGPDKLELGMTTSITPELDSEILTRIE